MIIWTPIIQMKKDIIGLLRERAGEVGMGDLYVILRVPAPWADYCTALLELEEEGRIRFRGDRGANKLFLSIVSAGGLQETLDQP